MPPRSNQRRPALRASPRARDRDPFEDLYVALNPQAPTHTRLVEALEAGGFRYMLIGAHARNAYIDDPRTTRDLDVVIAPEEFDAFLEKAKAIVARSKVKDRGDYATIARGNTHFLDIAKASGLWLYEEALPLAKPRAVPGLGEARVPAKEHIVAMKLLSALSPTRRFEKMLSDRADAASLVRLGVDRAALAPLVARIPGASALLEEIERGIREHP